MLKDTKLGTKIGMTIGRRIVLGFALLVIMALGLGAYAVFSLVELNGVTQRIITDPLPGLISAQRLSTGISENQQNWLQLAFARTEKKPKTSRPSARLRLSITRKRRNATRLPSTR